MKEHGTLFKADMVRALLRQADPKTQTRRRFTRHNSLVDGVRASPALWADLDFNEAWVDKGPSPAGNAGPYLKVPRRSEESVHRVYATIEAGDLLWVRETHRDARDAAAGRVLFRADGDIACGWTSPIHMPRALSRIMLRVTGVRIERLQNISGADARAEGCDHDDPCDHVRLACADIGCQGPDYRVGYRHLWEQINGAGSWADNPFVRVFEFARIKP